MGKQVLVVDDSSSIRTVVKTTLEKEGYNVLEAADGEEGLKRVEHEDFHLIICDVNMPKLDGISMVKKIKAMPGKKFIPICMLTTESEQNKIQEGKAAGAKAWIVKPFSPPKLLAAAKQLAGR